MHRTITELEEFLDHIGSAPSDGGAIEMIVRRPAEDERETVESGQLDRDLGLVGDDWSRRGEPHLGAQLTLISSRVLEAVAGERDRWPLAGDQIVVDLDLSKDNLPQGTRLKIGDAEVEVSPIPHTGCAKFASRYGREGLRFVNVGEGRERRFRGVYATVIQSGSFSVGDKVTKV
jgi:MOSC domain-containing protein YiiM